MPGRRRNIDGDVQVAIEQLALDGWSPAQILREVKRRREFAGRIPSPRTVQRIAQAVRPDDLTDMWTLADTTIELDPGDARKVLDVLAAALHRGRGGVAGLSVALVAWIARIHRVAPELDAARTLALARAYRLCEARGYSVSDLDALLAFAPWRTDASDETRRWAYSQAVASGWIEPPPEYLLAQLRLDIGNVWVQQMLPGFPPIEREVMD